MDPLPPPTRLRICSFRPPPARLRICSFRPPLAWTKSEYRSNTRRTGRWLPSFHSPCNPDQTRARPRSGPCHRLQRRSSMKRTTSNAYTRPHRIGGHWRYNPPHPLCKGTSSLIICAQPDGSRSIAMRPHFVASLFDTIKANAR